MKRLIIILTLCILFVSTTCFAELQCLIKVPAIEKIKKQNYTLTEKVREKFKQKGSRAYVTQDLLWNTRIWKNEKLINFVTEMGLSDLQSYIITEKLKWVILAATERIIEKGQLITQDLLGYDPLAVIDFIQRDRIYDDIGKLLTEIEPIKIEFGRFAGLPILKTKQQIIDALEVENNE